MLGLVDYGSGSDSDSDGEQIAQPQVTLVKNAKPPTVVLDADFFDEDIPQAESAAFNLPSATGGAQKLAVEEVELEGAVKPRDWELQMAEENKKKLEKRAKKKDKKEKKMKSKKDKEEKGVEAAPQKPKVKAKISAFGALAALDNDSDSDDEPTPRPSTIPAASATNGSKIGLFSMLPAPKGQKAGQDGKAAAVLLPPSLRKKTTPAPVPKITAAAPAVSKRKADSDDSDDGEYVTDFFGLSAAPEAKLPRLDDVPLMPSTGFGEAIGPSKPPVAVETAEEEDDQFDYDAAGPSHPQKARKGFINDEMVYNMLARDETVQAHDRRSLHEIAAGIIDVNVDQALGPNLQGNLLKNITRHAGAMKMPANLAPSKDPADKMARQKHQLSYLAKLAVSRDAALQEQWASSRNQKKMGREKYGF